jgi:formate dehydrogenase major subunit
MADKVYEKYPLVMTSGRVTEFAGGGDETRSNPWLAELMQNMYVEINPKAANDRGIKNGEYVWVHTPTGAKMKVMALVTERVGRGMVFMPFSFAGWWEGNDLLQYYPEGTAPIVRGEAMNTGSTYGYDSVTMMQEGTKTSLCQVARLV